MGLRETFQAAARTALRAAGNVPVSTNYMSVTSAVSAYNASAGTASALYATVAGPKALFEEFKLQRVKNDERADVEPQDQQATYAALDLGATVPKPGDKVVEGGRTWNVVNVFKDAAGAAFTCQVRR